jgi:hypothetical protein
MAGQTDWTQEFSQEIFLLKSIDLSVTVYMII